jgi:hypothetical protein
MNCIGFEPYPKMLYKANRLPNGQVSVGEVPPHPMFTPPQEMETRALWVESFNRSCQTIVHNEQEEQKAKNAGWCETMPQAMEGYERQQQEFARIAAEENFKVRRMSEKAQAEFEAAQDASEHHVVDVKPARKRGRPHKPVAPSESES